MPLATKNGSLIVKDGQLAEGCGCCESEWYCHVGQCVNAFYGGTTYKVMGQTAVLPPQHYSTFLEFSEQSQSLGTVFVSVFVQRVELLVCQFYLKIVIEVRATANAGYKVINWSPVFNANDYATGTSVTDYVSDADVQARQQALGASVQGTYNAPQWAQAWSSYGSPSFSVEMTFDEIVDARCVQ